MTAIGWVEALGYAAAGLTVAQYLMRTMIPLRMISIFASLMFLVYGLLAPSYPHVVLNAVLLPLNLIRLREMTKLVSQVRDASDASLSMEWLSSYSSRRMCRKGEILFRKNDEADAMYYTVSGSYRLTEIGVDIGPGHMIGEIAMATTDNRRTQSLECVEAGEVREISYEKVKELYFQNPQFGFHFLKLITQRLMANHSRLETQLAAANEANRELRARVAKRSRRRAAAG
ncbi:MAG: cyclic nucleotide-binding domain-containing protein [Hyphomicrobiales bacterium]